MESVKKHAMIPNQRPEKAAFSLKRRKEHNVNIGEKELRQDVHWMKKRFEACLVIVLESSNGSLGNTELWEELGRLIALAEHNNKRFPSNLASHIL